MRKSKITKTALAQRARNLIAGTAQYPLNGPLALNGHTFTSQSLIQFMQSLVDALAKADAAKATWLDTLMQLDDVRGNVVPVLAAYRAFLLATNGSAPAVLSAYGLAPRQVPAPLTTEQQAVAVAKRKATRAARHTLGPKQKRDIKGAPPAPSG